jgi:hypothetical protein
LTYPGVDAPGPSPRLEWRDAKQRRGIASMDGLKAD